VTTGATVDAPDAPAACGALRGVKVVDFGQHLAGSLCAMLLADQGADVVRIDPPGGSEGRSTSDAITQRGKRCIELDLRTPRDRDIAMALVGRADVVIENFRPGTMERFGFGLDPLLSRHPRLVYCSLPGFPSDDPRAALPAWEAVVAAATDTWRPPPGATGDDADRPLPLTIPVASSFAAMLGAQAIVAALIARDRDGLGQRVEVPLFDAMFAAIGARAMRRPGPPDPPLDATGFGIYRCGDGRCVHFAPVEPRFMDAFVDAAGLGAWRDEGLLDRARLAADPAHAAALRNRLTALFASRPVAAWETLAAQAGVPLAPCLSMSEWMAHPHARASGAILQVDDPELGPTLQPGRAVRVGATDLAVPSGRRRVAADAVLDNWNSGTGHDAVGAAVARTRLLSEQAAGVLQGVRILDLSQVWAGPTAARALAEYGADVVKVAAPDRPPMTHEDVNRGKRSVLLDLKDQADREALLRLVAGADVVLHNFSRGVAERLGIGERDLRQVRGDIVTATISCYGHDGPWGGRRGYEVQAQACAGAQVQFGAGGDARRLPYEINDYGTGALMAFGILLALRERAMTGRPQSVHAALAWTATLYQASFMAPNHAVGAQERSGPRVPGPNRLHCLLRARDGWLASGVARSRRDALAATLGVAVDADDEVVAQALSAAVALRSVDEAVAMLTTVGAGAHPLVPIARLVDDPLVRARGLVIERPHQGVGDVRTIGPVVRLQRTPLVPGRAATPPGTERDELLSLAPVTAK
jgi:crotonobetainyl-CoA:carnitine CoA-transferase CaiB-like acyl-CoA transferase